MSIWENLRRTFQQGNTLVRLIYMNVALFVLLKAIGITFLLFKVDVSLITWLAVPADLQLLLYRFWTPLTYMFLHQNFFHLFFNLLCLFWFGRIFLTVFSERNLFGLYILGGLAGAAFFVLAYNIFPYYHGLVFNSILLGASAAVLAIVVAAATRLPNTRIHLLLLGSIKLKYIAIVAVLLSFLKITDSNSGGELAHLGGALTGYLFVRFLSKGTDLTYTINRLLDGLMNLFRRPKMRIKKGGGYNKGSRKMSDAEYNAQKADTMKEIDRILDKIKESGYDSLSQKEKKQLFQQGKK